MEKDTKKRIMEEALNLFSLQGYEGTNLRDLASNLNLSKSAIYRHFSNKEDLLNKVLEDAESYYILKTNSITDLPKDLNELKKMTLEHINFTISDPFVVKCRKFLTIEQYRNAKIAKLASEHSIDGIKNNYLKVFNNLINLGCIIKRDTELMTFEYISPITLLINMIDREPLRKDECLDLINRHIDSFIENNRVG